MAKKSKSDPTPKKPPATFAVVFEGKGIAPEKLPFRVIADVLGSVQRLASGIDVDSAAHVPEEDAIGLLDVKRGSAVFSCFARNPHSATEHLRWTGEVLCSEVAPNDERPVDFILSPIRKLSQIAKSLRCSISVRSSDSRKVLAYVDLDTWDRVAKAMLTVGPTSIVGKVMRVGGATNQKCCLRVPGRDRLLYCEVPSRELARKMGQHLYSEIAATGIATWLNRSWKLMEFEILSMELHRASGYIDALNALYKSGGEAWDAIEDHERYIKGMRQ